MKRTIMTVAAAAAVLVLSGCGAGEEEKAKESLSQSFVKPGPSSQMLTLSKKEADCVSEDMVDGIGVDKLKEYDVLKEDGTANRNPKAAEMSQEDAETVVDAMFECTDVVESMRDVIGQAAGPQTPQVQQCFSKALTEDVARDILMLNFTGETEKMQQQLMGTFGECLGLGQPKS